jgi:alkylation response protein AidB-like acyl-CoA dehydrogenase
MTVRRITAPDDPALGALCTRLVELAPGLDEPDAWPAEQLRLCGEAGVFEWFIPQDLGGQGWSEADVLRGYVSLAAACLTTTFVITQRTGAMSRVAAGDSDAARAELLADLIAGRSFATVGISHLTTSRQHLARPVMRCEEHDDGFVFEGYSPWVTGAEFAQHIVLGGTLDDGRQVLVALQTDLPGVRIERSPRLVGLSASRTGPVHCERAFVEQKWLLAGPVLEVMKQGLGAKTGGSQTSALAIGLATAAIEFLAHQSDKRGDLVEPAEALAAERDALLDAMLSLPGGDAPTRRAARGTADTPTRRASEETAGGTPQRAFPTVANNNELRTRANSLALRASQAALAAAKGAGYVIGHPAGRWCREALFFLVWSCPQPVLAANLCELAGLE